MVKEKNKNQILLSRKSSKLMLIDDEKKLLVAIEKYLLIKQFNIIICNSGREALNVLKKETVDLLIIDIIMSDMNGYEFVNKLEKKAKIGHIPFIFLTAKGMTEDRIRGYKIGCKAYLAKPFDPEELVAVIDNILSDKKNIKNINNIKKEIQDLRKEINSFNKFNQNLTFTKREINILLAISQGLSNRDIANKLKISVRNVEKYVTRLLDKTNVCNRVKLANYKYLYNYNNGE
jgi:DNA-binding NarL/FixJ family response regulator